MQFSLAAIAAAAPASAGGGGNDGHSLPIFPHTGELIFGLVLFAVFFFLICKFVVPRLENAYVERVEAIEGDMSRAEKALAEAEELKAQYEAKLEEIRLEANRVREEARQDAARIVADMRQTAAEEAQRIIEAAQRQIQVDRDTAFVQLKSDVGRISTDLASRIVGESQESEVRQSGIVERFLAELEDGTLQRELNNEQGARSR